MKGEMESEWIYGSKTTQSDKSDCEFSSLLQFRLFHSLDARHYVVAQ